MRWSIWPLKILFLITYQDVFVLTVSFHAAPVDIIKDAASVAFLGHIDLANSVALC